MDDSNVVQLPVPRQAPTQQPKIKRRVV
jgi:hypothetical protein